ncbi:MAG: hypothetical protein Solumvirus5_12 [Solumvirus sp.]|uniref:Uncharacterized protein n=1 Tax=Solumvirus sp. TaxID=2487773 RepID=A0A3G5AGK0_9VIRU|nr:MAG: hypothetical protein Solumvirus5_12 [Solumvirus sp.]
MLIKRDRCVCDICGVEVNGWRPWHNPWGFHNYDRHPNTFRPQSLVSINTSIDSKRDTIDLTDDAKASSSSLQQSYPTPSPMLLQPSQNLLQPLLQSLSQPYLQSSHHPLLQPSQVLLHQNTSGNTTIVDPMITDEKHNKVGGSGSMGVTRT